ncbi:nuclear transport factor 2 family protein [Agromyces soli]|uniref:Nuclear transport factor 2 family protein n=1 Tax=Agromyces soli TaxID=659012 RepID=A0ABY4AXZ2_9MICO|nr:nuclear transport factor 2 family protein [Agromyces soli]UOE27724.1 nuclear transport factor 2 family protein [Agromyces soli]
MTSASLDDFVVALYRELGDRAAFDARLDPAVTVWETPWPTLMRGIAELDELRGPAVAPEDRAEPLPEVRPVEIVSDDFGAGTGLVRYVLEVRDPADGRLLERVRVTDVLRHGDEGWRIVHHHAQDLPADGAN